MMPSEAGVRLFGSARLNESDTRSNLIDPAIHERGWKVPDLISRRVSRDIVSGLKYNLNAEVGPLGLLL
jgi:type I site-specific restriction endonuclease